MLWLFRLVPIKSKDKRVIAPVCIKMRKKILISTEAHPGVAISSSFRVKTISAKVKDRVATAAQNIPIRASISSAKIIINLKPCSTNEIKFILLFPAYLTPRSIEQLEIDNLETSTVPGDVAGVGFFGSMN